MNVAFGIDGLGVGADVLSVRTANVMRHKIRHNLPTDVTKLVTRVMIRQTTEMR